MLDNVIEDQLTLAPRVTGVHQAIDILALDQLVEHLEARFGLLDRLQREVRRNDRQVGEGPFATLDLELLRTGQFQQVTDGRGKHVLLAFEVVVVFGEAAQRPRNIGGDRGFFGNDQLFGHGLTCRSAGA